MPGLSDGTTAAHQRPGRAVPESASLHMVFPWVSWLELKRKCTKTIRHCFGPPDVEPHGGYINASPFDFISLSYIPRTADFTTTAKPPYTQPNHNTFTMSNTVSILPPSPRPRLNVPFCLTPPLVAQRLTSSLGPRGHHGQDHICRQARQREDIRELTASSP